jgi:hypothetical protein
MFVIGAGESKTPLSFINACDRFFKLDSLLKKGLEKEDVSKKNKTQQRKKPTEPKDAKELKETKETKEAKDGKEKGKEVKDAKEEAKQRQAKGTPLPQYKEEKEEASEDVAYEIPREVIEDFVISLFDRSDRDELPLALVMQKIFQAYPDFNPKDYGVSKASKFFDGKKFTQKKGKGTEVLISLKEDI